MQRIIHKLWFTNAQLWFTPPQKVAQIIFYVYILNYNMNKWLRMYEYIIKYNAL